MVEAFVERRFELGEAAEVIVRFGRPVPEGEDYRCEYTIAWPSRALASFALGLDEVQALNLSIEKAHLELLVSDEARSRRQLRWLDSEELGLPLPSSVTPEDFK